MCCLYVDHGNMNMTCVMKKSQTAKAWTLNAFEGMCGRC